MNITVTYKNPDTDGVACLIGAGIYYGYTPTYQGRLSPETSFVLSQIGMDSPMLVHNYNDAQRIILVDTHHKAQLGEEFPAEKVVRIIDHHPGGDDSWFPYAQIDNRSIGAAASIIGEMFLERGGIDPVIAQLLQYGIASNTLNFTAPSTTDYDRDIFNRLRNCSKAIDIEGMLRSRTSGSVSSDVKFFDFNNSRIAISQIEEYMPMLDEEDVKKELNKLDEENDLMFSACNCVDIGRKRSTVYFSSGLSDEMIKFIFGFEAKNGVCEVERILLRKTDFIPALMKVKDTVWNEIAH